MYIDLDARLSITANDLEWKVLHVLLHVSIAELASNQSLDVENSSLRVAGKLILCGVSNEAFIVGESDPGRCDTVTLIVGEDFDYGEARLVCRRQLKLWTDLTFAILHDTDTRVCGTQINTDHWTSHGIVLQRCLVVGVGQCRKE